MHIRDLAQHSGVPAPTIRYYESIGLLPAPDRGANNYRQYTDAAVERVRFIASARSLGIPLAEIGQLLATRDAGVAPCTHLLAVLKAKLHEIDHHIDQMLQLRGTLRTLHAQGSLLPHDDIAGKDCICALVRTYRRDEPCPTHYPEEVAHD